MCDVCNLPEKKVYFLNRKRYEGQINNKVQVFHLIILDNKNQSTRIVNKKTETTTKPTINTSMNWN